MLYMPEADGESGDDMAHYKRGKCRKFCPRAIRGSRASWRVKAGLSARGDEWHPYLSMMSSRPAWWNRSMHTPQHRAACRRQLARLKHGADPDDLLMPIWGKPHSYYW